MSETVKGGEGPDAPDGRIALKKSCWKRAE